MRSILKTIIVVSFYFSLITLTKAQNWVHNYTFPTGYEVTQIQFINTNTGWATIKSGVTAKFMKTTNKGRNWTEINTYGLYPDPDLKTYFVFVNEFTGYRAHTPDNSSYTILDKTVNGGVSWTLEVNLVNIQALNPLIACVNSSEVYFFLDNKYSPYNIQVWKTLDGFNTYQQLYNQNPGLPNYSSYKFVQRDILTYPNGAASGVGFDIQGGSNTSFYQFHYLNFFSRGFGTYPTYLRFLYCALLNSDFRMIGTQEDVPSGYSGTRFYVSTSEQESNLIDAQTDYRNVGGLSFSNSSKGFMTANNKVYITNNSGTSWTHEGSLVSSVYSLDAHHRVKSFADVCYAVSSPGNFHTREISANYRSMFDFQQGTGTITVDGENKTTPSTGYFRGGTTKLSAPHNIGTDTSARFYFWGGDCNYTMNHLENNNYLVNSGSNIHADYKTKLKSTTSQALKNSDQVKIVKDTNGVTNLLYESMEGGIFFTRTTLPNGQFKAEEVVSGTSGNYGNVTFNNKNPYLCEVKPLGVVDPEENMYAIWERREDQNIKIMTSRRNAGEYPIVHEWFAGELLTINNAPQNFETFPKMFVAQNNNLPVFNELVIATYLKPEGNAKKLVARVKSSNGYVSYFDVTSAGNIHEYAVAGIYAVNEAKFYVHIVYRKDQTIYYKLVRLGQETQWQGTYPWYDVLVQDEAISIDNSGFRASVDISVKNASNNPSAYNMKPVVTYQGRRDVRIIVENEDGPPQEIQGSYYPIVVRERLQSGGWASGWIEYNSLNNVQQMPDVEGSKQRNSCLLTYGRIEGGTTKNLQVVPRWEGTAPNTYFCIPNQFTGPDAKLQKGAIVNASSTSQKLMTLSGTGSPYTIGTQNFNVTNNEEEIDGSYEAVSGTVINDNVMYSFNLGNIMVNWNTIAFSADIDTVIEDTPDFNENLKSETFLLNENDTLVIGRNAFYILESGDGEPLEIEYKVKLMNKTTETMHKLLAQDTIHSGDTIQVEYLEGFIITNVPNGSDSFYVQMEVDTLDGDFGVGGGSGGGEGGGDSPGLKRKIFWENEKLTVKDNTIPTSFSLYQNYPNPFNPATIIKYDLPKDVKVTIKVYDLLGREVEVLINEFKNAGRYELNWNANKYASGVYIYRIEAGSFVETKKMILLK